MLWHCDHMLFLWLLDHSKWHSEMINLLRRFLGVSMMPQETKTTLKNNKQKTKGLQSVTLFKIKAVIHKHPFSEWLISWWVRKQAKKDDENNSRAGCFISKISLIIFVVCTVSHSSQKWSHECLKGSMRIRNTQL